MVTRTVAGGMAWLMLFGPAVEHASYVFLAPVLCWAILESRRNAGRRVLIGAAFALVMVLGWGSLTRPLLDTVPALLAALPVGTALFAGWLVWRIGEPHDRRLHFGHTMKFTQHPVARLAHGSHHVS